MIRIDSGHLLQLLAELTPTLPGGQTFGGMPGVLLHTARGPYGDNPGLTTLLAGTSTNGPAVGHTHVPGDGTLEPTLIATQDVPVLQSWLGPRKKTNPDHTVEISRDLATITVQEPADLFDEGDTFTFHAGDLDSVPRHLWKHLAKGPLDWTGPPANTKGQDLPDSPRLEIDHAVLAPFLKVAAMRKERLQLYIGHPHRTVLVQIGARYRGAFSPVRWAADMAPGIAEQEGARPDGEVYAPELPPLKKKAPGPARVIDFRPKDQPLPIEVPGENQPSDEEIIAGAKAAFTGDKPTPPAFEPTPTP